MQNIAWMAQETIPGNLDGSLAKRFDRRGRAVLNIRADRRAGRKQE
jgi:hypothetical protein